MIWKTWNPRIMQWSCSYCLTDSTTETFIKYNGYTPMYAYSCFSCQLKILKVEIAECADNAIIKVFSLRKPKEIHGSDEWDFENQISSIKVKSNSQLSIVF